MFVPVNMTSENNIQAILTLAKQNLGYTDVTVSCADTAVAIETCNQSQALSHIPLILALESQRQVDLSSRPAWCETKQKSYNQKKRVYTLKNFQQALNVIHLVAGCWGDDQEGQHGVILTMPVWLPLRGRLRKPDALHPKRHGGA